MNPFRTRKSAGIRVGLAAYRLIRRGDAARSRNRWTEAADAYREALAIEPGLTHIWIQYGHMAKEAGAYFTAASAYLEAACLAPGDPAALGWLYAVPGRYSAQERKRLATALSSVQSDVIVATDGERPDETVFDVSDLVSYFTKARLPTGIQRVQTEVVGSLLREGTAAVRVCCSIEGRGEWVEVPPSLFLRLAELSVRSGDNRDSEWMASLNALNLSLMLADPIRFGPRATLVNLGTSWWLHDYFLQVRNAKAAYGVRYVPFVHDLIPIVTPQHCVEGLVREFVSWIMGVFEHADGFLVSSHATERDLHAIAKVMGHAIPPGRIGHAPLNADFRPPLRPVARDAPLPRSFGLAGRPYVLFVSTIESRKGHTVALDAWAKLIDRHASTAPILVCVGKDGWLNEAVHARIATLPALEKKIVFLSGISDADLAQLYRDCLFTIYPSFYEGWGLPITEALCHGKPVITCDNSSLPQAGGPFATYVKTGSATELAAAVERFCFEEGALAAAEEHIATGFAPRSWAEIGQDIMTLTKALPASSLIDLNHPRPLEPGAWYSMTRNRQTRVWRGIASAEMYRVGAGWALLDERCAWILPGGARLALPLTVSEGPCRLIVRLIARRPAAVEIQVDGRLLATEDVASGEERWSILSLAVKGDRPCVVDIVPRPSPSDQATALGLAGFAICQEGSNAFTTLLESIVVDRLDRVTAFRERHPAGAGVAFRSLLKSSHPATARSGPHPELELRPRRRFNPFANGL